MSDADDLEKLVTRAKAGDADAFGTLYEEYAPRVFRFALARVSEPADAEDLLHRVFLKVIEALPRYEQRGLPFGAWLFRIAGNAVVDFHRTDRHSISIDTVQGRPDEVPGPMRILEVAEERAAIRAALSALTADQRDVLVYRFFAGLSPAEVGALMGKREGAIRALQFRALERLRATDEIRVLGAELALGGLA
jgi:RNA polymerase sigma-70 factor (ECF subfamily)